MALQATGDLPKALRARKLAVEQGDQQVFGRQLPHPMVGTMPRHKTIELVPRNPLQKIMKNAILVPHGVAPLSCPGDAPTSEHK
jgi:hypothetical protein